MTLTTRTGISGLMATLERCDSMDDLRFLDPEALVNRAAFNERFGMLNNAVFNNGGTLEDILGNAVGVQIETGSYTGTGTYGSSNPNSLTFGFEPKIVIITTNSNGALGWSGVFNCLALTEGWQRYAYVLGGATNAYFYIDEDNRAKLVGNTLSWYAQNENQQLNTSGKIGTYIALG